MPIDYGPEARQAGFEPASRPWEGRVLPGWTTTARLLTEEPFFFNVLLPEKKI